MLDCGGMTDSDKHAHFSRHKISYERTFFIVIFALGLIVIFLHFLDGERKKLRAEHSSLFAFLERRSTQRANIGLG